MVALMKPGCVIFYIMAHHSPCLIRFAELSSVSLAHFIECSCKLRTEASFLDFISADFPAEGERSQSAEWVK